MADVSLRASGIYAIRNNINGKIYVGSATCFRARWNMHRYKLRLKSHHSPKLQAAWNKYGEEAFVFEVIEVVPDIDLLLSREQFHIDASGAAGKGGYNILPMAGSRRGHPHTAESRGRISAALAGVPRPGAGAAFRGKKLSAEHVAKVVARHKGSQRSAEARSNISAAMKGRRSWLGRKHSQETREKLSVIAKARKPQVRQKHTPETIEMFRAAHAHRRVPVIVHEVWYESYQAAADALGFHKTRIGQLVKEGKARRAGLE